MAERPASREIYVQALLAEYSTLRAEILQRNTVLNQAYIASGSVTIAILGLIFTQSPAIGSALLPILAIYLYAVFRRADRDTKKAAQRVREIERAINHRLGEPLLVWESQEGILAHGYGERWQYYFGEVYTVMQKIWNGLGGFARKLLRARSP